MADDVEKLRKQVKAAFQLRALSLKRDALEYAVRILLDFDGEQRVKWIDRILAALAKENVTLPMVDVETFQSAVKLCTNKKPNKSETLFNVLDLYSVPRLEYDESCQRLIAAPNKTTRVGDCNDLIHLYRNRFQLVHQRTMRCTALEHCKLTTVETLLGSSKKADDVIVLGMLSEKSADTYQIEDLTGSVPVELKDANFHSGVFTVGSVMLLEGSYDAGLFTARGVGLAPIETAYATRTHFGNDNWFGGDSTVAYHTVPRLQTANANNPDERIVFVSDIWLDSPKIMNGIYSLLAGFSEMPPIAFVFCGNFCSRTGTFDANTELAKGFRHFANIIAEQIAEHPQLTKSHFVFVPGPDDPSLCSFLPRPSLPSTLQNIMRKVPNFTFTTNPCRIQFANQEIVVFREDIIEKMCKNSIHLPEKGANIAENVCRTIASVGHLCPLPLHISPVLWSLDHTLLLYPLPDLVVLADRFQQFTVMQHNCLFANPGSFSRSHLDFHVYYPASCEIEPSSVNI